MKKPILILCVLAVATVAAIWLSSRSVDKAAGPAAASGGAVVSVAPTSGPVAAPRVQATDAKPAKSDGGVPAKALRSTQEEIAFAAMIDTLVSPKSTYAERQAAFKQLIDSGRIQDALAELQQRAANDTNNADIASALGQAYLKACGTTKDVRSQAVWAMEADQSFEAALNIDPNNWEARFTKAVAMTFWPENLNKGPEIVNQFNTLIQQQEQEAPQPQFASTYEWLGREYDKLGQADLAQQTWQRGAALFPNDQTLRGRLASNQ